MSSKSQAPVSTFSSLRKPAISEPGLWVLRSLSQPNYLWDLIPSVLEICPGMPKLDGGKVTERRCDFTASFPQGSSPTGLLEEVRSWVWWHMFRLLHQRPIWNISMDAAGRKMDSFFPFKLNYVGFFPTWEMLTPCQKNPQTKIQANKECWTEAFSLWNQKSK